VEEAQAYGLALLAAWSVERKDRHIADGVDVSSGRRVRRWRFDFREAEDGSAGVAAGRQRG
jgi:hypothetical protein